MAGLEAIATERLRGERLRPRRRPAASRAIAIGRIRGSSREPVGREAIVDEEVFNMSVRKFLKKLGVTAQREIELAVREQLERGDLQGDETLDATATVTVAGLSRDVVVTGKISLG
jgi:Family of unknown function (DUF6494)